MTNQAILVDLVDFLKRQLNEKAVHLPHEFWVSNRRTEPRIGPSRTVRGDECNSGNEDVRTFKGENTPNIRIPTTKEK